MAITTDFFICSKEKEEIDFLVYLPNDRYIGIEVKAAPIDMSTHQLRLLASLNLNVVVRWIVSPTSSVDFPHARVIRLDALFDNLKAVACFKT